MGIVANNAATIIAAASVRQGAMRLALRRACAPGWIPAHAEMMGKGRE